MHRCPRCALRADSTSRARAARAWTGSRCPTPSPLCCRRLSNGFRAKRLRNKHCEKLPRHCVDLFSWLGRERNAVAMRVDFALHYLAGPERLWRCTWDEVYAVVAILPFLFPDINVLHG